MWVPSYDSALFTYISTTVYIIPCLYTFEHIVLYMADSLVQYNVTCFLAWVYDNILAYIPSLHGVTRLISPGSTELPRVLPNFYNYSSMGGYTLTFNSISTVPGRFYLGYIIDRVALSSCFLHYEQEWHFIRRTWLP